MMASMHTHWLSWIAIINIVNAATFEDLCEPTFTSLVGYQPPPSYSVWRDIGGNDYYFENEWYNGQTRQTSITMPDGTKYNDFIVIVPNDPGGYAEWNLNKQFHFFTAVIGVPTDAGCYDPNSVCYGVCNSQFKFYVDDDLEPVHISRNMNEETAYERIEILVSDATKLRIETLSVGVNTCDHDIVANPELISITCAHCDPILTSLVGYHPPPTHSVWRDGDGNDYYFENEWYNGQTSITMPDGTTYSDFIVIVPNDPGGFAEWNLDSQFDFFTGVIGVPTDAGCYDPNSVCYGVCNSQFTFWLNHYWEESVHTSREMSEATAYERIGIVVSDATSLRIAILSLGVNYCDHDVIANPVLIQCKTKAPSQAPTHPTAAPTHPTKAPSQAPTHPTAAPVTPAPTHPTTAPSQAPTHPTTAPVTQAPTHPTTAPTFECDSNVDCTKPDLCHKKGNNQKCCLPYGFEQNTDRHCRNCCEQTPCDDPDQFDCGFGICNWTCRDTTWTPV